MCLLVSSKFKECAQMCPLVSSKFICAYVVKIRPFNTYNKTENVIQMISQYYKQYICNAYLSFLKVICAYVITPTL